MLHTRLVISTYCILYAFPCLVLLCFGLEIAIYYIIFNNSRWKWMTATVWVATHMPPPHTHARMYVHTHTCTHTDKRICVYITTTTKKHHYTVQVAQVQVRCLRQWVEGKHHWLKLQYGWNHHVCKWSICANGRRRNTTTVNCCWWQPPQAQGAKVRVQGAKVRPASAQVGTGCSNNMQL